MAVVFMDGYDRYGGPTPTPQSIWDENELEDYLCDRLANGEVIRLASSPICPPEEVISDMEDCINYVADYRAEQRNGRHWRVYGKFPTDPEWKEVGWIVR